MAGTAFTPTLSSELPIRRSASVTASRGEEEALIRGLLSDDPIAWAKFSARYSRLILSCISRVLMRFDGASLDDVNEVHAALCIQLLLHDKRKLRSFESGRGVQFSSWLGLLATHAAYDFLRAMRRVRQFDELGRASSVSTEVPDPSEMVLRRERVQLLEDALATFSKKDRVFVELYYARGLEPEEIAVQLGISVKTVYSKRHKLQVRLEALLGEDRLAA